MAQFTNTFAVSGIICNDATVHTFAQNVLAKFGLSISREDTRAERGYASAILNCEAWRTAEYAWQFDQLKKGAHLTLSGFFVPQEWTDANGQHRSSVVLRVTHIENTDPKPAENDAPADDAAPATDAPVVESASDDAPF